jgi:RNA polymerase sigma-70 factor, ECF subfamily
MTAQQRSERPASFQFGVASTIIARSRLTAGPVMSSRFERSTDEPKTTARGRFELLCGPYRTDVLRFLIWLCRDRALAEDVMQETLLRAWKSFDALADTNAVRAWLLTIARRELARVFERKRLPTIDLDSALAVHDGALATSDGQDVEDMRRAIFQLEPTYREPLVMQVLLGLSTEEIAKELSISVPAVLTRLYRARELLRQRIGIAEKSK